MQLQRLQLSILLQLSVQCVRALSCQLMYPNFLSCCDIGNCSPEGRCPICSSIVLISFSVSCAFLLRLVMSSLIPNIFERISKTAFDAIASTTYPEVSP